MGVEEGNIKVMDVEMITEICPRYILTSSNYGVQTKETLSSIHSMFEIHTISFKHL